MRPSTGQPAFSLSKAARLFTVFVKQEMQIDSSFAPILKGFESVFSTESHR